MMSRTQFAALVTAVCAFAASPGAIAGEVTVADPYARASAGMAKAGAAFMTLTNTAGTADRLVSASAPICTATELHTHIRDGDVMKMRQVEAIDLPPSGTVQLQPGGLHVMFMGLTAPLKEGESFPLTLTFEKAGPITVQVPVKAAAAMAPMSPMPHHGGPGKPGQ